MRQFSPLNQLATARLARLGKTPLRFGRRKSWRRGAAATEAAICLPILVLLTFGSIELANGVFLKRTLAVAAYEACRVASRPGATQGDGELRAQEVLHARGITNYTIDFSPPVAADTPRGTELMVTVSTPGSAHAISPLRFLGTRTISHYLRMVRL